MAALDALWHGVASGRPYALLLLDARMPDTDGLTVAAKIRERQELSASRIILMTSGDRPSDLERYRELRIDAHLLKPVPQDELLEAILAVMSRQTREDRQTQEDREDAPATVSPVAAPVTPLSILVAEDDEFNAHLMEKLLAKKGHRVRVASNGRETLRLLEEDRPDVLLLDLHMPEMDGFQVIAAIREGERATGARLAVIAVTASARRQDRERCLAAGMDEFLTKPIEADALGTIIDRVIGAR
jgi:CheY-like chemotaxis protein